MAVDLELEGHELVVRVSGLDRLVCFSSGFRVPFDQMVAVGTASWDEVRSGLSWRTMGTYVPALIATGWYAVPGRPGARQFLAVFRSREHLLVIDTNLVKPSRVVLGHPRADEIVSRLNHLLTN